MRSFTLLTIGTIYVLILLGGIVRATGSGLGCPDWPRCFGRWIPPTCECQLPPDYKTRYATHALTEADVTFNPIKTWIEYLNRLAGALVGIFIFITALLAWRTYGFGSRIFWLAAAGLLLTGIQGWLGSKVVSTGLAPYMISLHNLLAQIIVYLLLAAYWLSRHPIQRAIVSPRERNLALTALGLLIIQFYLGVQVRQVVDTQRHLGAPDSTLFHYLTDPATSYFYVHRSFSWVVLLFIAWQAWQFFRVRTSPSPPNPPLPTEKERVALTSSQTFSSPSAPWRKGRGRARRLPDTENPANKSPLSFPAGGKERGLGGEDGVPDEAAFLQRLGLACVIANVAVGVCLQFFMVPAWAQPIHLLLASLLLGVFFSIFMLGLAPRAQPLAR